MEIEAAKVLNHPIAPRVAALQGHWLSNERTSETPEVTRPESRLLNLGAKSGETFKIRYPCLPSLLREKPPSSSRMYQG